VGTFSGDGNDRDDAHCCRALGSAIERGVRVGLRILVTRFQQKVLPGLGPGAVSSDVSVWRLLVLA
jgi:hypothetical protein